MRHGGGSGKVFERFVLTQPIHEAERDPAGALVSTTGLSKANTGGYELVEALVIGMGLDPASFALMCGVNLEDRQVALYPVDGKTAGALPVRRNARRKEMTLYLQPVFKRYKELKPTVRQQGGLFLDLDADGEECVVLALNTGLDKPVVKRKEKNG